MIAIARRARLPRCLCVRRAQRGSGRLPGPTWWSNVLCPARMCGVGPRINGVTLGASTHRILAGMRSAARSRRAASSACWSAPSWPRFHQLDALFCPAWTLLRCVNAARWRPPVVVVCARPVRDVCGDDCCRPGHDTDLAPLGVVEHRVTPHPFNCDRRPHLPVKSAGPTSRVRSGRTAAAPVRLDRSPPPPVMRLAESVGGPAILHRVRLSVWRPHGCQFAGVGWGGGVSKPRVGAPGVVTDRGTGCHGVR